jgi:HlyD family secretion protein
LRIRRKHLFIAIIAVAIVGALALSFRPDAVPVTVAQVERGPLRVTIEEEGRVRVRERYDISAPVMGYAPRVPFDVGDTVEKGQVLIRLLPRPAELLDPRSREQAQAAVAEAQAAWDFARQELARLKKLHARGDVSDSALNEAQARAEQARAVLRSARAQLTEGGTPSDSLQPVPLHSPVTGRVLAVQHESAGTVAAGTTLMTVGDSRALEIAIDVLSEEAVRLRPGMPVELTRWGGDVTLEGVVKTIEPTAFTKVSALGVEEQRVWVVSEITSPPEQWAALGDRYRVEASFILWQAEDVLKVPASALFRAGSGWAVFVLEDDKARLKKVKVGKQSELEAQILEGLSAGQRVITHPDNSLEDGATVKVGKP